MATPGSRRPSVPSRTFGTPVATDAAEGAGHTDDSPSMGRRLLGSISLSSLRNARPSFSFSRGGNSTISSTPETERPPIPTMMQSSGEVYSTPLPKLSMTVLSITMLAEFLSANVSTPFLLFMVKGFGEFSDEAEVAFWTGILVATFFLTQFLTSLLWATVAEKHGRRAVLMISLLGSAITCCIFGTATTIQQAICIRLLQGIFAGAVGVARGSVTVVTDPSNEGRAYAILGFCWGFGGVAGAVIGGSFERPATKWPEIFGEFQLFLTYPYLLPCIIAAVIMAFGSFLALFLGQDGGPRDGAIRLLPEKSTTPSIPEEDNVSQVFEDEDEPRGLAQRLQKQVSRRFSGLFANRVPDNHNSNPHSPPLAQPAVQLSTQPSLTRLDRTRTFSSSRNNGSAYGYGANYRSRLESNATWTARRGSLASSMRRRRGSNMESVRDGNTNFAQRLLLANEHAVTNIADLWVAAAMNVDNDDPFLSDSDIEEDVEDAEDGQNAYGDEAVAGTSSPLAGRVPGSHRPSVATSLHPSVTTPPRLSGQRPSVSFSPMPRRPSSTRRPSTSVPAIFAHPGVKTPSAVLDAQQLLFSSTDSPHVENAASDLLGTIREGSSAPSADEARDVEALDEKPPSLMSQLPIVVIVQYGVMALHTTTHDQIFMSYLVSDYESGGLNLNAGHFAQLIALMCFVQIAYQFYLYPNIGPPRGRFSHLAMFRIGTIMYIPAYLTVVLYRPLHNLNSDDTNIILMTALSISTAVRYCGTVFGYTAISILLNYMTPPQAVGYANGIAQSIVSLARCVGPVIGGYLWSASVQDGPSGYYLGFLVCAAVCGVTVIQSFLIR
ncbi:hypothetical protein CPB83DRAFT_851026 [Crepidotus variabilis]|uniref:Major facilitator superfamily MFS-1 n=1 Tax=Crepidotus variabilis TaxID=179855 RepID=A0A9P6EJQ3_9AGAR|nr:hypothetical protein CPB83DRAFT_851026 [Crepidotus variabilis]